MSPALERYSAKRRFARTSEPPPKAPGARQGPLLFVVQKHAARRLHYDFRIELDGVLKSWAVPKGPSLDPAEKRLAVEVEDHPFEYATFEGVIPQHEYGAGSVIVWDCGVYSPDADGLSSFTDRTEAQDRLRGELAAGKVSILLCGAKLKGSFTLVRTRTPKQWLLIKHQDRFARSADDVLAQADSLLSGARLDEPAREALPRLPAAQLVPTGPAESMPGRLEPMLAHIGSAARSDPQWRYEPKLDGYRIIAFVHGKDVRLQSRRGLDLTARFPEIVAELALQPAPMILDGELVALDAAGRPSFNALQNRVQAQNAAAIAAAEREAPTVLMCFDLLHFAGVCLRGACYRDRRRYLAQCLAPSAHVQLVHASADAEALYRVSLAHGFEGIMAKRLDSAYESGRRSKAWLKMKAIQSAEFLVGGYTQGTGARAPLGALLLGFRDGRALRYAGHVGSGLDAGAIRTILERARRIRRVSSPFAQRPPLHRPTTWLKPTLVAEVSFSEWTPDGALRAPVFLRLRDDVAPESVRDPRTGEKRAPASRRPPPAQRSGRTARTTTAATADETAVILEQLDQAADRLELRVGDARIGLTHLDRVYWPAAGRKQPATTKRDLLRYLASVGRFMLPHLRDRPLTMIRMPQGINGQRFFQKHWTQSLPEFVESVTVYSGSKDEQQRYLLANNLPTLLWLGQVGTLEFHVWHSRAQLAPECAGASTDYASSLASLEASILNYPDYLVFDIDPYIYSGKEPKGAEPEYNKRAFTTARRVALWLRALLKEMSLEPVVKTSGKTGLHIFVPIVRTVDFDEARRLCETVGRHVLREHQREVTMEWAVAKRTGKIFIDYNMNARGKTLNSAYSPRGIAGAPVSMPLTWEELEAAEPADFTLSTVPARLARSGDRWHDLLERKQNLAEAFGMET